MITLTPASRLPLAWRIGWRDLARDWRRGVLVVLLIMVPLTVLMSTTIVITSMQAKRDDLARVHLGQAAGALTPLACRPQVDVVYPSCDIQLGQEAGVEPATEPTLRAAVPPGQYAVLERRYTSVVTIGDVPVQVDALEVDAGDPLLRGRYELVDGAWPTGTEILVNEVLAERGLRPGTTAAVAGNRYRVAGTVRVYLGKAAADVRLPVLVLGPGHPGVTASKDDHQYLRIYLGGGVPALGAYPDLNGRGVGVVDRSRILNEGEDFASDAGAASMVVIGGLLALVVAILVAGSALAVGAKRKERVLALLSATGARPHLLRAIFLAQGGAIGLVAAIGGIVLALLGSAAFLPLVEEFRWGWVFGYHVPWTWLGAGLVVSVAAGMLAAIVPGLRVAGADPARALREKHHLARPWVALVGLGLAGLAVVATITIVAAGDPVRQAKGFGSPALQPYGYGLAAAIVVVVIGVLLAVPLVLRLVGTAPSWLPLGWRLAARDLGRAGHRTVPTTVAIVAAAMAAGAVVVSAGFYVESMRNQHAWQAREGEVVAQLPHTADDAAAERVIAGINRIAPLAEHRIIRAAGPAGGTGATVEVADPPENSCDGRSQDDMAKDWRCQDGPQGSPRYGISGIIIGDASLLPILGGVEATPALQRHLDAGGAIVLERREVDAVGRVAFLRRDATTCRSGGCQSPAAHDLGSVPALLVQPNGPWYRVVVVSEATARRLALVTDDEPVRNIVWAKAKVVPTADQADQIRAVAERETQGGWALAERGPADLTAIPWLFSGVMAAMLLLVVTITTALAMADRRADEAVLGVLGASPLLRRSMAAAQAAWVGAVGAVLGVALGAFLAVAVVRLIYGMVPRPVLELGLLAIGVPLLAAGIAWLTTPGRAGLRVAVGSGRPQTIGGDG